MLTLTDETMNRRMSKLQQAILEELEDRPTKTANISDLSMRVANRYAPDKVWRLKDVENPYARGLARSLHRQDETIRNIFSATFSRSLRNLEEKGLVQLVKGKYDIVWNSEGYTAYRIVTNRPRVTFIVHHKSKYFGKSDPDISFIIDLVKDVWRDINNKKQGNES